MALRLIRCPHCRQRFNVAGVPSGTKIQCTFCAKPLLAPSAPPPRRLLPERSIAQVAVAGAAGLALAFGAYLFLRSERPASPGPVVVGAQPAPATQEDRSDRRFVNSGDRWKDRIPEVRQLLLDEFDRIATKEEYPFLVAVESGQRFVPTSIIDDYAKRLKMLYELFKKEFAGPLNLPVVNDVLPVVILNSRESYDRYCEKRHGKKMPDQITGMYEYSRRRIVMYHDSWAPYEVILHEGAHQLVHYYQRLVESSPYHAKRGSVNSYWFQEGIGTYFEGFRRRDDEIILDPQVNRNRLPAVVKALKEGSFLSVSRLTKMTIEDFWKWYESRESDDASRAALAQLYYAESWALVHFMLNGEEGRYHRAFLSYFESELKGDGTFETFERIVRNVTGLDLPAFEAAFVQHIQSLK